MKTLSKAMLISFLFMALTASFFSNTLALQAVLDINGAPLKPNVPYFIKSATQLTQYVTRGKRFLSSTLCPQAVLLSTTPTAVKFVLKTGGDNIVPLSAELSIVFDGVDATCLNSGLWQVVYNPLLLLSDITATGSLFALDSTFRIVKSNGTYKLVYGVSPIGFYADMISLVRWLVVFPDEPLSVDFIKSI